MSFVHKWATVLDGQADNTPVSKSMLGLAASAPEPQPTSGDVWQVNAARLIIDRSTASASGYVRDDDTGGTDAGMLSWFDYIGAPSAAQVLQQGRDSSDAQTFGALLNSNNRLHVTYGSGTYGAYLDLSSGGLNLANGTYAVQTRVHCDASAAYVDLKLFSEDLGTQIGSTISNTGLALSRTDMGHFRFGGFGPDSVYSTSVLAGQGIAGGVITEGDDLRDLFAPTPVVYFSSDGSTAVPCEVYYSPDGTSVVRVDIA